MIETQVKSIAKMLLSGRKLTALEAFTMFGTTCFHRRLTDVKNLGISFTDEWVSTKKGKKFKVYFIPKYDLKTQREKYERIKKSL